MAGKRKREKELPGQPVGHSLREQGPVGAGFYARKGWTGGEGICSDSASEAELEVGIEPLALEGAAVEVIQGGGEEGAAGKLDGKMKRKEELAHQPAPTGLARGPQRAAV